MVVEQIDLIYIKQTTVGSGQHPRLEVALAALDSQFDVQGAHHPVLGGADRQVHKAGSAVGYGQLLAKLYSIAAVVAEGLKLLRIAVEGTTAHYFDLWQQGGQGAGCGGLSRAPLAADQHPADLGADGVQDEGHLHFLLADDSCEGENSWHINSGLMR